MSKILVTIYFLECRMYVTVSTNGDGWLGEVITYLFGFLKLTPSSGFSYVACTAVIIPVAGSLSKVVAVIGNGTFNNPTVLPGASRK